jgi:uncharacterized membrane protein YkvA (DUF1232 family)
MWKRLSALWLLVRGDAKTLWRALRQPDAPFWLKAGTARLLLSLASPIDLLPELTRPFLGLVDDLVLIPAAIRWMLNRLPARLREDLAATARKNPAR